MAKVRILFHALEYNPWCLHFKPAHVHILILYFVYCNTLLTIPFAAQDSWGVMYIMSG